MKIEKTKLYQWDTNQIITGLTGLYVDFIAEESVYRVDVADGKCIIPDEVLQVPGIHRFYECFEDHTMNEYSLRVIERLPPPDYAYTPTRQITFEELVGRVDALVLEIYRRADAGEFDGPPGKDYVITEKDYQDIASIVEKEINPVKSVNDITPDENGNVELTDIGKVNDVVIDGESVVTNKIARIPIGNERLGVVSAARHYLATTDLSGDIHAVTVQQAIFDSAFTPDEAFVSKGTLNNVFAARLASYAPLTALNAYLTITDAKNTYATKSSLEGYITIAAADIRYATKNSLNSYLTISSAANTYVTKSSLNNILHDYLTTSAASSTYATKASLNNYLTTSAASSTYATKTSLNSYVTKTTADSTYATKDTTDGLSTRIDTLDSETLELYQSVEDLNDRIDKLEFVKIVDELPETGEPNIVYFVPKTETKESDLFDEYMWINSKWEFLGTKTIDIDLSEYAKKTEVETAIDTEALRFDKTQSLSSTQKAQAITNVGLDNVETLVENDGYVDLVAFTPEEAAKLVTDVQVNGVSQVVDGVANIPYITQTVAGVGKVNSNYGTGVIGGDIIRVWGANEDTINSRNNNFQPITSAKLDYAVEAAMGDGKGAPWSEEHQANARQRLGFNDFVKVVDITTEEEITAPEFEFNGIYKEVEIYISNSSTAIGNAFAEIGLLHKKNDIPSLAEAIKYYLGGKKYLYCRGRIYDKYFDGVATTSDYDSYTHTNMAGTFYPMFPPYKLNEAYLPTKDSTFYKVSYNGTMPTGTRVVIYAR